MGVLRWELDDQGRGFSSWAAQSGVRILLLGISTAPWVHPVWGRCQQHPVTGAAFEALLPPTLPFWMLVSVVGIFPPLYVPEQPGDVFGQ